MARRRTRGLVGVGALVAVAAAGWWWTRGREQDATDKDDHARGGAGAGRTGRMRARRPPLPQRPWQHLETDARRIAGIVTYKGAPVGGATVRLELDARLRGAVPQQELTTGADGRFDFGPRIGGPSRVSATADGRAPAGLWMDLRDPTISPPPDELVLELDDCVRTAEGTVRDAGGPIAGATLRASPDAALAVTATDADGNYRMCVPQGRLSMTALADGYARATVTTDGGRRVRQDFELLPEVTVDGIVLDAEERPVAGALVTAQLATDEPWRGTATRAVSGDDGRFSFAGAQPGRYRLTARAAGQSSGDPIDVVAKVGEPPPNAVLRLQPLVVVRGRVVESGKPVSGAVVALVPSTRYSYDIDFFTGYDPIDTITQRDGTFVLDGVAPGPFEIEVRQFELLSPKQQVAALPETDLTIEVVGMASIAGHVTRGGRPMPDALVRLEGSQVGYGNRTTTKSDGSFLLRGIAPGRYKVAAQVDTAFARGVPVTLTKGQELDGVAIELDLAAEIAGVVVDQHGTPVDGAEVSFVLGGNKDFGRAMTEDDGSFVAAALSGGGDYAVRVHPSAGSGDSLEPASGGSFAPIAVADGSTRVTGVRLAVRIDRGEIGGVVVHADGSPAVDVKVSASRSWQGDDVRAAITDATGRFRLRDLIGGPFRIEARTGTGLAASERRVALGRSDLRLVLPAAGAIEATLAGFGPGAIVTASSFDSGTYRAIAEQGKYRIRDVAPGRYDLTAREGEAIDSISLRVQPGKTTFARLTTEGVASIKGQAIDAATRAPVAGAYCRLSISLGNAGGRATTDAEGRFGMTVPALRDVNVICYGSDERREGGNAAVRLEPGTTKDVVIEIAPPRPPPVKKPVDLGMTIEGPPPKVASVVPGGAADRAGLRAGDVLVSIDGTECDTFSGDLARILIAGNEIGEKVKLVIERGGNRLELELEIVGAE